MGGGEGKKKKESKKASWQPSAELQPEPAAEGGGIRDWPDDDDDDDRWGSECFKCGQDGDLLCCEVRARTRYSIYLSLSDGTSNTFGRGLPSLAGGSKASHQGLGCRTQLAKGKTEGLVDRP